MRKTFSIREVSDALGVSRDMVERWVKLGKVKGERKNPFAGKTSPIFISASELERLKKLQHDAKKS